MLTERKTSPQDIKEAFLSEHNPYRGCEIKLQGTVVNSVECDPATGDPLPDYSAQILVCLTHSAKSVPFIE